MVNVKLTISGRVLVLHMATTGCGRGGSSTTSSGLLILSITQTDIQII